MLGEISVLRGIDARRDPSPPRTEAFEYGNGVWFPHGGPLAALRAILPTWFPRVGEIITLIGSHNLSSGAEPCPTRRSDAAPAHRELPARREGSRRRDRARIFRLAWDFVGSALASRNELYERFYLASGARNYLLAHALSLKDRANRLVDGILGKEHGTRRRPRTRSAASSASLCEKVPREEALPQTQRHGVSEKDKAPVAAFCVSVPLWLILQRF